MNQETKMVPLCNNATPEEVRKLEMEGKCVLNPYAANPYSQPIQAPYPQPIQAPYPQPIQAPYPQPIQAPYPQPIQAPMQQPQSEISVHGSQCEELVYGLNTLIKNQNRSLEITQKITKENEKLKRQKRATKVNYAIVESPYECLGLVTTYSNGVQSIEPLTKNLYGASEVFILEFPSESLINKHWEIRFESWSIVGEFEGLNPKKLYSTFVNNGVIFSDVVPEKIIKKVIFDTYYRRMTNAQNHYHIEYLAGWGCSDEKLPAVFHEGARSRFREEIKIGNHLEFKRFDLMSENVDALQSYAQIVEGIQDDGIRIVIQYLPFLSLLYTLYADANMQFSKVLNLIFVDGFLKSSVIENFLKIFDRDINCLGCDITQIKTQILGQAKDEVVIARAVTTEVESYYQKQKINEKIQWMQSLVSGDALLATPYNRNIKCNVALLSNFKIPKSICVYISNEDLRHLEEHMKNQQMDIVSAVYSMFVKFVSCNFPQIIMLMRNSSKSYSYSTEAFILQNINEILQMFYTHYSIDCQSLKEDIGYFETFVQSESENYIEIFVEELAKQAKNLFFKSKNTKDFNENTIYFDEENLLITDAVWEDLLNKALLQGCKKQVLVNLKLEKVLLTDPEGGKHRATIAGKRQEMFRLDRKLVEDYVGIDVVKLGKVEKKKCLTNFKINMKSQKHPMHIK